MENQIGKQLAEMATRRVLGYGGAALAMHGIALSESSKAMAVQVGIAALMAAADVAWSIYDKYVRRWITAKLEVMAAKAELQAEALKQARVSPPTATEIAARVPDPKVTPEVVRQAVAETSG